MQRELSNNEKRIFSHNEFIQVEEMYKKIDETV